MNYLVVLKYIQMAAGMALSKNPEADLRAYWMAAVGVRGDGIVVSSRNGSVIASGHQSSKWSFPKCHAEARLCRKLDYLSTVYVARVAKADGSLLNARPCPDCARAMTARQVKRVYYSINNREYGVMDLTGGERTVSRGLGTTSAA